MSNSACSNTPDREQSAVLYFDVGEYLFELHSPEAPMDDAWSDDDPDVGDEIGPDWGAYASAFASYMIRSN